MPILQHFNIQYTHNVIAMKTALFISHQQLNTEILSQQCRDNYYEISHFAFLYHNGSMQYITENSPYINFHTKLCFNSVIVIWSGGPDIMYVFKLSPDTNDNFRSNGGCDYACHSQQSLCFKPPSSPCMCTNCLQTDMSYMYK